MVDRALRHLLTDVTGNTHRSEFCVDKLYSPDSLRGRLGLLELRGFEMPPHPDMALVQALLIRTVLARCAEQPYRAPLIRWGAGLHEQYLLPHHVAADLADVAADLRRHGFDVDLTWFEPFLAFRFPVIGRRTIDAGSAGVVDLELRTAIEPWHVLGQESSSAGPARYVDSSVERLQVKVTGFDPDRLLLTCNGSSVPLSPTDHRRGVRRRSPVQGVEPVVVAASLPRGGLAAGVRRGRPGQSTVPRRSDLSRGAPRAAGRTPRRRSTPRRPRRGGPAVSRRWVTRRA